MWLLNRFTPAVQIGGTALRPIGWSVVAIAVALDIYSVRSFFKARTSVSPLKLDRCSTLVTTGLYRISRNPMYLGLVLALIGWTLVLGNASCLLAVWGFVRVLEVLQIEPEESALRRNFGTAYSDYSLRVNRWIGWSST
jgi:protein-S-isoprenylcysteine O-methyltransferase Ste14